MAIKEQIGYPDYILEDQNEKLDQEYANVRMLCMPPCITAYTYFLATKPVQVWFPSDWTAHRIGSVEHANK